MSGKLSVHIWLCVVGMKGRLTLTLLPFSLLAGTHMSFRTVFSAVGDLQALIGQAPCALLSATASPASEQPLADLFHIPISDLAIVRDSGNVFKKNISITIHKVNDEDAVSGGISAYLGYLDDDAEYDVLPQKPRRALVLAPTKESVRKIAEFIRQSFGLGDKDVAAVDGDSSLAHIENAIKNCKVIVATTILSTSATIPKLDLCIIASTSYSVQVSPLSCMHGCKWPLSYLIPLPLPLSPSLYHSLSFSNSGYHPNHWSHRTNG